MMEQAGGVLQLQLLLDAPAVDIHGLRAEVQRLGDLLRALAAAQQLEDFKLPIGKLFDRRGGPARPTAGHGVEHPCQHLRAAVGLPAQDEADDLQHFLRSGVLRKTDLAGRWGGEEFVVALLSTPVEGAMIAAERIRVAIETMVVTDDKGQRLPVTASIGLAAMRATENLDGFLDRADKAMYASKSAGRNRVTISSGDREAAEPRKQSPFETGRIARTP